MVAVVGIIIVFVISSITFSQCEGEHLLHPQTAVARTPSTSAAYFHAAVSYRAAAEDEWWKMISKMVKDGVDVGHTLLQLFQWPLDMGLSLHNAFISQIGALISWFNFLVGFVTPGGMGSAFLSWLRGDPSKSTQGPYQSYFL